MRDIRLLTLYKQHYLDSYKKPMECQFTCLGYFDGMDIDQVEQKDIGRKHPKMSDAPISELWYAAGHKIEAMEGGYSGQDIGMFRCMPDDGDNKVSLFWDEMARIPFLAVGFLQMKNGGEYVGLGDRLEKPQTDQKDQAAGIICRSLTYCTYDNADLILLIQGNHMGEIQKILQRVEKDREVSYMHTILGISEGYLKACKSAEKILTDWNGTKCHVATLLKRVSIQLVTSGDPMVLNGLKDILKQEAKKYGGIKGYEQITYSYVTGHQNISVTLPDTDIKSLLVLLLPGGFATHQNIMYERGVYNISTSFEMDEKERNGLDDISAAGQKIDLANKTGNGQGTEETIVWSRELIKTYRERLQNATEKGEDSIASYYQAMIRTLITLGQYENFGLAKDIFYLLFPAFDMFDRQLDEALKRVGSAKIGHTEEIETIKEELCQFLELADSVIYHTIHTDQMYLMIPGYSGASFSIPIKLSLLYLWSINKISDILKDNKNEYGCILAPKIESRPMTRAVELGPMDGDRLICVLLSQRTLYLPRYLLIILTHEVGHYVGCGLRDRTFRLVQMIKTLAYFIAEGVLQEFWEEACADQEEKGPIAALGLKEDIRAKIREDAYDHLEKGMIQQCPGRTYYGEEIQNVLIQCCIQFLSESHKGVHGIIWGTAIDRLKENEKSEMISLKDMDTIYRFQVRLDKNREHLLSSRFFERLIPELIGAYREVFSDMAALAILRCSQEDFREAFSVSEGMDTKKENVASQWEVREWIVGQIIQEGADTGPDRESPTDKFASAWNKGKRKSREQWMYDNMYAYSWTRKHLFEYASVCYKRLVVHVWQDRWKQDPEEIEQLFKIFKGEPQIQCHAIYAHIYKRIGSYKAMVEERYRKRTRVDKKQ